MTNAVVKIIDISPDEYTAESIEELNYEIKSSNLTINYVRDSAKFKKQTAAIKKLNVNQMFVVDKAPKAASTWAQRMGKQLHRHFIVRKLTKNLTEIHRVK